MAIRDRGPRGRQGAGLDRAARGSRHEGPLLASTHAKGAHPLASSRRFGPARSDDSAFSLQFLGRSGCACRILERGAPRLVARPHHPAAGSACFLPQPVEVRVVRTPAERCAVPDRGARARAELAGLAEPADPCRSERDRPVAIPPGHAGDARRVTPQAGDSRGRRSAAAFRMELAHQGRAALHRSGVSSRRGRREACARARAGRR